MLIQDTNKQTSCRIIWTAVCNWK